MSTAAERGGGESSRRVGGCHSQPLTWVGDHHQDAVGTVLDNVWDDELEDVDVALNQVEAALALLLAGSGRHHHHLGISGDAVVWKMDRLSDAAELKQFGVLWGVSHRRISSFTLVSHNFVRLEEERSVLQVHGFTFQLILHYIDQGQLIAQVLVPHAHALKNSSIGRFTHIYLTHLSGNTSRHNCIEVGLGGSKSDLIHLCLDNQQPSGLLSHAAGWHSCSSECEDNVTKKRFTAPDLYNDIF